MKCSSRRAVILGLRLIFMQALIPFLQDVVLSPASVLHTQGSASAPCPWLLRPGSLHSLLTPSTCSWDMILCYVSWLLISQVFFGLFFFVAHFLNTIGLKDPFLGDFIFYFFLVSIKKTSVSAKKCTYLQCNISLQFGLQLALHICMCGCPYPCIQLTMEGKQSEKCCICTEHGETFLQSLLPQTVVQPDESHNMCTV